jgi:AraC-like DNA-binding protein
MFKRFAPHPLLRDWIDSLLVQEEFHAVNYANRNPVKVLPSALAVIGIQYGAPMNLLASGREERMGTSGLTGLQSTYKEYVSTGSIGTIIVRFKPGGLAAFTPCPTHEFRDANIDLNLVFAPSAVSEMELRVREARTAEERVAAVQRFLWSIFRQKERDRFVQEAIRRMLTEPGSVAVERLAGELFVSKRTLERKFNEEVGISPKKFAGIVRFQRAIDLRKSGRGYLDIVEACGFSDHAHFAHDFKEFAGCSPERFFGAERQPELARHFNEPAQSMYH